MRVYLVDGIKMFSDYCGYKAPGGLLSLFAVVVFLKFRSKNQSSLYVKVTFYVFVVTLSLQSKSQII